MCVAPMACDFDEQSGRDGLAGQARAGGAKSHGDSRALAELEELGDFIFGFRQHDGLGNQAIEAGVGGKGDEVDRANENAVGINLRSERGLDPGGRERGRGQYGCSHVDNSLPRFVNGARLLENFEFSRRPRYMRPPGELDEVTTCTRGVRSTYHCRTRCVNGGTYAMRNTRMPTRHANAILWKKT